MEDCYIWKGCFLMKSTQKMYKFIIKQSGWKRKNSLRLCHYILSQSDMSLLNERDTVSLCKAFCWGAKFKKLCKWRCQGNKSVFHLKSSSASVCVTTAIWDFLIFFFPLSDVIVYKNNEEEMYTLSTLIWIIRALSSSSYSFFSCRHRKQKNMK